jgi:hypothetical protein
MPTPAVSTRKPTLSSTPSIAAAVEDHNPPTRCGLRKLPTRPTYNPSIGPTIRLWHARNRDLLERVAAGLRHLDYPAACQNAEPVRGRAHAIHLMADHATHRCRRFRLAAQYIEAQQ